MDKICAELNMPSLVERGPGMFTTDEYAMRYNIAAGTASDRLRKLVKLGKIEYIGLGEHKVKFYRIK